MDFYIASLAVSRLSNVQTGVPPVPYVLARSRAGVAAAATHAIGQVLTNATADNCFSVP